MAPHLESFSRNFTGQQRDVHYFVMLLGESLNVTDFFRPKLLPAAYQNCGFPAFTDTNKGLLTCIQNTAASTASLTAAEFHVCPCLSGCQSKGVALDRFFSIWMHNTKMLWMPWGFTNDYRICWVLDSWT